MSVHVDTRVFAQQLAVRGLNQDDVALLSGLSRSVVSSAARGKPISGPTFARLAVALAAAPVVAPDAERLLRQPPAGDGVGG